MITHLLSIDPGLSIGTALCSISHDQTHCRLTQFQLRTIPLEGEGIFEIAELIQKVDFVLVEQFTNPFATLTKEAKSTIELVGFIKGFSTLVSKEYSTCVQAQKTGYLTLAKKLAPASKNKDIAKIKHSHDALAHAIRFLEKKFKYDIRNILWGDDVK